MEKSEAEEGREEGMEEVEAEGWRKEEVGGGMSWSRMKGWWKSDVSKVRSTGAGGAGAGVGGGGVGEGEGEEEGGTEDGAEGGGEERRWH